MGTTLFGQQINLTYEGLIKTSDNGIIQDTGKYIGDGLGNDSVIALTTSKVGINNLSPATLLHTTASSNNIEVSRVDNSAGNDGAVQGITHLGLAFFSAGANSAVRLTSYQDGNAGWPGGFTISTRSTNADVAPSERLRITSDGALLVGSTSKGTAAADVIQRNGDMYMLSRVNGTVGVGGFSTIIVTNTTSGYQGILVIGITGLTDSNLRTQATYSIFGDGSNFVATAIASANGSSGAVSFTITSPSQGFITITNTEVSESVSVHMQFFGGLSR